MFADIPVTDATAAALYLGDPDAARDYLTDFSDDPAETIAAAWWGKEVGFQRGPKKYGKTQGVLKKYLEPNPVAAALWAETE